MFSVQSGKLVVIEQNVPYYFQFKMLKTTCALLGAKDDFVFETCFPGAGLRDKWHRRRMDAYLCIPEGQYSLLVRLPFVAPDKAEWLEEQKRYKQPVQVEDYKIVGTYGSDDTEPHM